MRLRFSLFLTIAAVVLWGYCLTTSFLEFGLFGASQGYHISFFISLGLLLIASSILWFDKENHGPLLTLQLLLFITAIWLTPLLLGNNPLWADHVFRDFDEGQYIAQFGHLNPNLTTLWYHNWPGVYLVQAVIIKFFNLSDPTGIARFGELIAQYIILLPLYLMVKNFIDNINYRLAACFVFFLGNWAAEFYFNPQGFSIFFVFCIFALLTRRDYNKSVGVNFALMLFMFSVVITHLLTSVFCVLGVVGIMLVKGIKALNLVMLFIVMAGFWTLYGAVIELEGSLRIYLQRAFDFERLFEFITRSPGAHSTQSAILTSDIRLALLCVVALLAIGGFLLYSQYKNKNSLGAASMIAMSLIMLFAVFYDRIAGPMRTYIYSLAPSSILTVNLLKRGFTAIIIVPILLLMIPLRIAAYDGNSGVSQHLSTSEIAYWRFINVSSVPASLFGGIRILKYQYISTTLDTIKWDSANIVIAADELPQLIHIGTIDQIRANNAILNYNPSLIGQISEALVTSTKYSVVYSNPQVNVYYLPALRGS